MRTRTLLKSKSFNLSGMRNTILRYGFHLKSNQKRPTNRMIQDARISCPNIPNRLRDEYPLEFRYSKI